MSKIYLFDIIYSRTGEPLLRVFSNGRIVNFRGKSIGFIYEDKIYNYSGKHVGWYWYGLFRDIHGNCVGFGEKVSDNIKPLLPLKQLKPLPGILEIEPIRPIMSIPYLKPLRSFMWSNFNLINLFY